MKPFILTLLLFFFILPYSISADSVTLKDDSILIGEVLHITTEILVIETAIGELEIKISSIKTIELEPDSGLLKQVEVDLREKNKVRYRNEGYTAFILEQFNNELDISILIGGKYYFYNFLALSYFYSKSIFYSINMTTGVSIQANVNIGVWHPHISFGLIGGLREDYRDNGLLGGLKLAIAPLLFKVDDFVISLGEVAYIRNLRESDLFDEGGWYLEVNCIQVSLLF